uniref:Uncharacterized protein n=1 Tax=Nelumbo nucifera TaxID=4432 RepID=A0A822YY22_NELNU|nr:TPA_asm: hypothetical protein HUJ06_008051 [Nelumbo nucifera]
MADEEIPKGPRPKNMTCINSRSTFCQMHNPINIQYVLHMGK